jgi:hypothetical protein
MPGAAPSGLVKIEAAAGRDNAGALRRASRRSRLAHGQKSLSVSIAKAPGNDAGAGGAHHPGRQGVKGDGGVF